MSSRLPHRNAPGIALGIDDAMVRRLVHAFYAEVRADPALGPVFSRKITDWEQHLETMISFWSSIALMTGQYKGKPIPAHLGLGVRLTHFARWLALFEQAARKVCPPEAAEFFVDRAHRIAQSLQLGIGLVDPLTNQPAGKASQV